MAKLGEGDPRWIVRERKDGRNVKNWHWTERDASQWSHARIRALLSDLKGEEAGRVVQVTEVDRADGDVTLYNRKGKLKVVYDLNVEGKFDGREKGMGDGLGMEVGTDDEEEASQGTAATKGRFKFALFEEEPDVVVTVEAGGDVKYKELFKKLIVPNILKAVKVYLTELYEGGDVGLKGITFDENRRASKTEENMKTGTDEHNVTVPPSSTTSEEKLVERKQRSAELSLTETFSCSTHDLYLALTDRPRIEGYTRAKAVSDPTPGGEFELRDQTVTGTYVELVPGKRIVEHWRMKDWPEDAGDSTVTIELQDRAGKVELSLKQTGVPADCLSTTEGFWRIQIFQAIKIIMGYGSANFL